MEAKEYIRERTRMFDSLRAAGYKGKTSCDGILCNNCPMNCSSECVKHAEQSVDIVEKWSKEHPIKTIMMDFFEKHPNAEKYDDGRPRFCAGELGYKVECREAGGCHDCWNTPLEEAE